MYKNYLFDLYGTLVDINTDEEKKDLWKKLANTYKGYGARYTTRGIKKTYIKLCDEAEKALEEKLNCTNVEISLEEVFEKMFTLKKVNVSKDVVVDIMKLFRKESTKYIRLYDGVLDVLNTLKKKKKKKNLLSNAQYYFTMPEIEVLGIKDFFDGIVISSSEHCKKPDSKFFGILFERYGLKKEESVMIGNDSVNDIDGAKAFGIDSFYIYSNISPESDKDKSVSSTYKSINGNVRDYLTIVK